ncbi:leucine-rich repeat transmembrane protein FLRT1-like [Clavelina lepadiformis]|uniref:leucine-rich repeat transmembrane protein FLRT1-like n=1 Tax=Clavelina lepadiformis TaxID=159417 RepID=UPI004041FE3B
MHVHVIFGLLFILATALPTNGDVCPKKCRCRRGIVYCNERRLTYVPADIPLTTKVLHLQGNKIVNSKSSDQNLKRLIQLKKLNLYNNKLASFPKSLPKSLEYLSLQQNQIRYIARDALEGLSSLTELNLDYNNISDEGLSPTAFQGARSLKDLVLTGNTLQSVPMNLPKSLKWLRMDRNHVSFVSVHATARLSGLSKLDMSHNKLIRISPKALHELKNLTYLNLASNYFEKIPVFPQRSQLTELILSRNKIRYIDRDELRNLFHLSQLDLSSNGLESVEDGGFNDFQNLRSLELHDNPWRCNCYLKYLKTWLEQTTTVVSNLKNIKCHSPPHFRDVTISSIDLEVLTCNADTGKNIIISEVSTHFVRLGYIPDSHDPFYLKYSILYGTFASENCTLPSLPADQSVTLVMKKWYTISMESPFVNLTNLDDDTRYVICIITRYDAEITPSTCQEVITLKPALATTSYVAAESLPVWAIATICSTLLLILGLSFLVWKVHSETKQTKLSTRSDPKSWLYASSITLDARQEFNVTLRPRPMVTSQRSLSNDVISTTHTGMTTVIGEVNTPPQRPISFHERYNENNEVIIENCNWTASQNTDLNDTGIYV